MGIKKKYIHIPPIDDSAPPSDNDFILCWGCDKSFFFMSLCETGLCYKCQGIISKNTKQEN